MIPDITFNSVALLKTSFSPNRNLDVLNIFPVVSKSPFFTFKLFKIPSFVKPDAVLTLAPNVSTSNNSFSPILYLASFEESTNCLLFSSTVLTIFALDFSLVLNINLLLNDDGITASKEAIIVASGILLPSAIDSIFISVPTPFPISTGLLPVISEDNTNAF